MKKRDTTKPPPPPKPTPKKSLSSDPDIKASSGLTDKEIKEFEKAIVESVVVIEGVKRYKNGLDVSKFLYLYSKLNNKQRAHYKGLLPM